MEALLQSIEWVPTLVSFVLAFGLGWIWYSPVLFGHRWAEELGINTADASGAPGKAMIAQAVGTLLFAIIINLATAAGDIMLAVLVALAIATFIKANGLFSQKTSYVIMVEVCYILAMAVLMIGTNLLL